MVAKSTNRRFAITAKHVILIIIILGIAFRIGSLINRDVGFDANYFLTMGQALTKHGEFYLPWGDPSNLNGVPSYSHHVSPLYPTLFGLFYFTFGESYIVPKVASLIISLLTLVVIFWTTRDLFGRERALVVSAIFAIDYELIIETGKLYSENLTMLFFALTIWAIIKGVKDDKYITLAGLFAGLAYLARASLGYFFIIAGVGGFLWRFYYMRWGVFKNKWYMLAIVIFLGMVGGWGLRNLYHFGWPNWETSTAIQNTIINAFSQPVEYLVLILLLVPFFILILLTYGAYWLPELKGTLRRIKDEQISGLWLAVFLIPFIALFISGALSLDETQKGVPLFWRDRMRYILYAFIPLVWLAVRKVDFQLDRSIGDSVREFGVSYQHIKIRFNEILQNRLWITSILILIVAGVTSLIIVGGWLAAFLVVAASALVFRSPRKRLAIFLAVLLVFSIEAGTAEVKFAAPSAGADISNMLGPNEVVAVDGTTWHQFYFLYPFVHDPETHILPYDGNTTPDYIASYQVSASYTGYTAIGYYYDNTRGGLISETFATIIGSTTQESKLSIVLWKHN